MALVLTLVAVPLSRLRPRQGRYARVGFAIVVYFVYSNLLSPSKVWLEKGDLPPAIGVWWVHAGGTWASGCTWSMRDARNGVNILDRYLYRTVLDLHLDGDGRAADVGRTGAVHQSAKRHRRRQLQRRPTPFYSRCSICRSKRSNCCRSAH